VRFAGFVDEHPAGASTRGAVVVARGRVVVARAGEGEQDGSPGGHEWARES